MSSTVYTDMWYPVTPTFSPSPVAAINDDDLTTMTATSIDLLSASNSSNLFIAPYGADHQFSVNENCSSSTSSVSPQSLPESSLSEATPAGLDYTAFYDNTFLSDDLWAEISALSTNFEQPSYTSALNQSSHTVVFSTPPHSSPSSASTSYSPVALSTSLPQAAWNSLPTANSAPESSYLAPEGYQSTVPLTSDGAHTVDNNPWASPSSSTSSYESSSSPQEFHTPPPPSGSWASPLASSWSSSTPPTTLPRSSSSSDAELSPYTSAPSTDDQVRPLEQHANASGTSGYFRSSPTPPSGYASASSPSASSQSSSSPASPSTGPQTFPGDTSHFFDRWFEARFPPSMFGTMTFNSGWSGKYNYAVNAVQNDTHPFAIKDALNPTPLAIEPKQVHDLQSHKEIVTPINESILSNAGQEHPSIRAQDTAKHPASRESANGSKITTRAAGSKSARHDPVPCSGRSTKGKGKQSGSDVAPRPQKAGAMPGALHPVGHKAAKMEARPLNLFFHLETGKSGLYADRRAKWKQAPLVQQTEVPIPDHLDYVDASALPNASSSRNPPAWRAYAPDM